MLFFSHGKNYEGEQTKAGVTTQDGFSDSSCPYSYSIVLRLQTCRVSSRRREKIKGKSHLSAESDPFYQDNNFSEVPHSRLSFISH